MDIPFEIVDLIIHFMGGYSLNLKERPYIKDIKIIGRVSEYGVKRSLIHLKEIKVLIKAYQCNNIYRTFILQE